MQADILARNVWDSFLYVRNKNLLVILIFLIASDLRPLPCCRASLASRLGTAKMGFFNTNGRASAQDHERVNRLPAQGQKDNALVSPVKNNNFRGSPTDAQMPPKSPISPEAAPDGSSQIPQHARNNSDVSDIAAELATHDLGDSPAPKILDSGTLNEQNRDESQSDGRHENSVGLPQAVEQESSNGSAFPNAEFPSSMVRDTDDHTASKSLPTASETPRDSPDGKSRRSVATAESILKQMEASLNRRTFEVDSRMTSFAEDPSQDAVDQLRSETGQADSSAQPDLDSSLQENSQVADHRHQDDGLEQRLHIEGLESATRKPPGDRAKELAIIQDQNPVASPIEESRSDKIQDGDTRQEINIDWQNQDKELSNAKEPLRDSGETQKLSKLAALEDMLQTIQAEKWINDWKFCDGPSLPVSLSARSTGTID